MKGLMLDRDKFWVLFRQYGFGTKVSQTVVITTGTFESLSYILDRFETESRFDNFPQFAYFLATVYHESGRSVKLPNGSRVFETFKPIRELKARAGTDLWNRYQSKYWNTGYYGRGLVQTTWKSNYLKVGQLIGAGDLFVQNPDKLLDIRYSYETAVEGMVQGIYRSDRRGRKSLDRYFPSDTATIDNYVAARDIINGDIKKNGLKIAKIAMAFEAILRECEIQREVPALDSTPAEWTEGVKPEYEYEYSDYNIPEPDEAEEMPVVAEIPNVVDSSTIRDVPMNSMSAVPSPPVNVEVPTTKSTGLWTKVTGGITAIFTGTYIVPEFIQNFFKGTFSEQYATLLINSLPFLVVTGLGFTIIWYIVKKVNNYKLTELYVKTNTNPDVHNFQFVERPKEPSKIKQFLQR